MLTEAIRFGSFEYRPASLQLLKHGEPVPLGSRAFALLGTLLCAPPGQYVPHSQLVAAAWPSTFVDACNLRVQMSRLRRLLDEPGRPSLITNAPGRGYALRAPSPPPVPVVIGAFPEHAGWVTGRGRLEGSVMLDHGQRKFPHAQLLATSRGRGWMGIGAELRSHPAGGIPAILPEQMEITLTLSGDGRGIVRRSGNGARQETPVSPGTLWLCPIGVKEDSILISEPIERVAHVYLPASGFVALSAESRGMPVRPDSIAYVAGLNDPLVEQIIRTVIAELEVETAGGRVLVETLGLSLVALMAHNYRAGDPVRIEELVVGAIDGARLARVLDLIASEIEADLSVERLAEAACLSRFHFSRAFKKAVGMPPHRYIAERRLDHARSLLATTARPLADIALACRFSSQASFTRAFVRAAGVTPGKYRALTY